MKVIIYRRVEGDNNNKYSVYPDNLQLDDSSLPNFLSSFGISVVSFADGSGSYTTLDVSSFSSDIPLLFSLDFNFVVNGVLLNFVDSQFPYSYYSSTFRLYNIVNTYVLLIPAFPVDYSALVNNLSTIQFLETSLNGANGAKFKDGDIVQVQGFPSQYEVVSSQYIVNNDNVATVMYKVKDVNTAMIHYVPQVFLTLVSSVNSENSGG